jgi:hypothetical protein
MARRWTRPPTRLVIAASIFIASIVATVSPALICWPDLDREGDDAGERGSDLTGL